MNPFADLEPIYDDPYIRAKEEKEKGRNVIGVTPMHFPEELVHASGALPVTLQTTEEPITLGWQHLFPHFCSFTRTNVDLAVKRKLDLFDAVVVSDVCLQLRSFAMVMKRNMPVPFLHMNWPLEQNLERWQPVLLRDLGRVRQALEGITGKVIADEDIARSIQLFNRNRELLRRVDELRRHKPGVLSARDMQLLVVSSMVMPREEHNTLLEGLIPKLEKAPAAAENRVKIWLTGYLCQRVLPEILETIEASGGVVVGDDMYVGSRYYAARVPTDIPPMEALLQRHYNFGIPCPTRIENSDWGDFIVQSVQESGAQAVIFLLVKQCECPTYYYPHIAKMLREAGIPIIRIDIEHEMASFERIRTLSTALVESASAG